MSTRLLSPVSSTALALPNNASKSWGLIPPLGNLESYVSAVHRLPLLTLEEEQQYAKDLQASGDLEAARKLILSHLRLVVSVSRQYLGYGLPHADLIQEGNVGLMKAVKRFDPDMGVRLVSYAMHWIKAEIHEYIIKNWRMVKVATTKAQRKLFFNLRSMKQALIAQSAQDAYAAADTLEAGGVLTPEMFELADMSRTTLNERDVQSMAKNLKVKPEEVREMERRMSGGDVVLDASPDDGEDEAFTAIHYLRDETHEPSSLLQARERDTMASDGVEAALDALDERSRRIVTERWLRVNDDGSGGLTLHDLAAEYGVSAERIRQIEAAAMKKMKTLLLANA